jgi:hypothetical protein
VTNTFGTSAARIRRGLISFESRGLVLVPMAARCSRGSGVSFQKCADRLAGEKDRIARYAVALVRRTKRSGLKARISFPDKPDQLQLKVFEMPERTGRLTRLGIYFQRQIEENFRSNWPAFAPASHECPRHSQAVAREWLMLQSRSGESLRSQRAYSFERCEGSAFGGTS